MYNEIKAKIESYLLKEDIIADEEVISAYDLKIALENEFGQLFNFFKNGGILEDPNKSVRFFKKKPFSPFKYVFFTSKISDPFSSISYVGENFSSAEIVKSLDDNNLFYSREVNDPFLQKYFRKNLDSIIFAFEMMEQFRKKYNYGIDHNKIYHFEGNQVVSDAFFHIEYKVEQNAFTWIGLNDRQQQEIYTTNWVEKQRLSDIVEQNSDIFLRKIPVEVSKLKPLYRKAVEFSSKDKEFQKVLK